MNKTIASLALLKVNWDTNTQRKDFIEIFVPFIATLINRKNYEVVDVNTICKDFENEYGLIIPYHPMMAILTRTMKNGYIQRGYNGNYVPVREKLVTDDFTDISIEQERKYKKILDKFLKFCQENHGETLSEVEAECVFVSFLKDHDLDILFITQELNTLLPGTTASPVQKYLINSFVKNANESDPEIFNFIIDISVGHIIANTLVFSDIDKFQGNLSGCNFYLDIGFLFNILGINGVEKKEAYIDFVQLLLDNKAGVFVFNHTYDEFRGILEGCLQWIENTYFDPLKASRAAIYFVDNQFTASDVEQFILSISEKLSELKIQNKDTPVPLEELDYQIDEAKLIDVIVDLYRSNVPNFDELEKEETIHKDVKSISAIYKFRKGEKPTKLQEAKHIFVTTNSSLAYANKLFETQDPGKKYFFIPAVLTDVFVGTLIWLQSPTKVTEVNEKRLIANCYAALQPNRAMVKKLTEAAERLKSESVITSEDVTLLKQSRVARNLLQEETLGDPNRFTDKTITEILDEIRAGIREEEQDKFSQDRETFQVKEKTLSDRIEQERELVQVAKKNHFKTKEELVRIRNEKEEIEKNIETLAERITYIILLVYYLFFIAIIIIAVIAQSCPNVFGNNSLCVTLVIIAIILTILNLVTGFNIMGAGKKLKTLLKQKIISFLKVNSKTR